MWYTAPKAVDVNISYIIIPPPVGKGQHALRLSVHPSVCPSVAYIANNSRTQRLSVPKFGMKVPHL